MDNTSELLDALERGFGTLRAITVAGMQSQHGVQAWLVTRVGSAPAIIRLVDALKLFSIRL